MAVVYYVKINIFKLFWTHGAHDLFLQVQTYLNRWRAMWTLTSSKGRQAERNARRKEWLILIVRCSVLPSLLGSCVINSRNGLFNWNPSKDALIQLRLVMSHQWKIFYFEYRLQHRSLPARKHGRPILFAARSLGIFLTSTSENIFQRFSKY